MDTRTTIDRWVILDECGDTDVAREIDRTFARDAERAPGTSPVFEDPRDRLHAGVRQRRRQPLTQVWRAAHRDEPAGQGRRTA